MMRWYKITAPSEDASRKIIKSLRGQHLLVRSRNGNLFACTSSNHQVWLSRVCQDFGASLKVLEQAPEGIIVPRREVYIAPCGEKLFDPILFSQHCRFCPKCNPKRAPEVTAKLEPGKELNLDGVISSIEVTRDQLQDKVNDITALLDNLRAYHDAKSMLSELTTEVSKRIDAVRLLLRDGKL